jgi:hypothetical protein
VRRRGSVCSTALLLVCLELKSDSFSYRSIPKLQHYPLPSPTIRTHLSIRRDGSRLSNVKILITLPDRKGCVRSEEFMSEDLGEEDIVGDVVGLNMWQQMAP